MKHHEHSVLVVDDDADTLYALTTILKKCDCLVDQADSIEAALALMDKTYYDIVFCDLLFHVGPNGDELLDAVRRHHDEIDVVIISSILDTEHETALLSKGAVMCLQKPLFKSMFLDTFALLNNLHLQAA